MSWRCSNPVCNQKATAIHIGTRVIRGRGVVDARYPRCDEHPLSTAREVRPLPEAVVAAPKSYEEALLSARKELTVLDHRRQSLQAAIQGLKRLLKDDDDG